jgi:hypothetical protein
LAPAGTLQRRHPLPAGDRASGRRPDRLRPLRTLGDGAGDGALASWLALGPLGDWHNRFTMAHPEPVQPLGQRAAGHGQLTMAGRVENLVSPPEACPRQRHIWLK